MLEPLAPFQLKATELSAEQFRGFCRAPVFVVDPFEEVDDTGFRTLPAARTGLPADGKQVVRIVKRSGSNAFSTMITMGRASNNDIQVRAAEVSKFHAYVRLETDGSYAITDSGSSFGTTVQGKALDPRLDRVKLATGDEVRLGKLVRLTFVAARDVQSFVLQNLALTPSRRMRRV